MPTVRSLTRMDIREIAMTATLREAAMELTEEQVGSLIVRNGQNVSGILTEVDIVRALADDADPDEERVRDHMTDTVVTIDGGEDTEAAWSLMKQHEIRHLLVTEGDVPIGVLSIRDVLRVHSAMDA